MLVLERGRNESVYIRTAEGLITVKVFGVTEWGRVRLGIDAPKTVAIERDDMKNRPLEMPTAKACEGRSIPTAFNPKRG